MPSPRTPKASVTSRVPVLGNEHGKPSLEAVMQRRDDQQQGRLGHPSAVGERISEGLETLGLGQLADGWSTGRSGRQAEPTGSAAPMLLATAVLTGAGSATPVMISVMRTA